MQQAKERGARWGTLFLIFLGMVAFVQFIKQVSETPEERKAEEQKVEQRREEQQKAEQQKIKRDWAKAHVSLDKYRWYKDESGLFMTGVFTIVNNTDVPVKDFEIRCVHFGPSGTRIDSNTRTIYQIIQPKSKRTFRQDMGFIHSQAASSSCELTDLAVAGPEH